MDSAVCLTVRPAQPARGRRHPVCAPAPGRERVQRGEIPGCGHAHTHLVAGHQGREDLTPSGLHLLGHRQHGRYDGCARMPAGRAVAVVQIQRARRRAVGEAAAKPPGAGRRRTRYPHSPRRPAVPRRPAQSWPPPTALRPQRPRSDPAHSAAPSPRLPPGYPPPAGAGYTLRVFQWCTSRVSPLDPLTPRILEPFIPPGD